MKKTLLTLAGVGLTTTLVFAQQQTVRGTIISAEDGQPVIGATVVVKGQTTIGVATNIDGQFTLNVPQNAKTLVISYVGFKTQEVPVGKNLKITLEPETQLVDEVVVVAYGVQKKESFVGSQTSVSAKNLEKRPITNISTALGGISPGVQVALNTGQPGSSASLRIRGIGSMNASSAPIYVVDGAIYDGSIADINPADIQNVAVLKDAASTAIYGSSSGNGVILITTKSGMGSANNKPTFNFTMNQGFSRRGQKDYERLDVWQHYPLRWTQWYNDYKYTQRKRDAKTGQMIPFTDDEARAYASHFVVNSLRYNPFLGVTQKGLEGLPLIVGTDGKLNSEITGLAYGDDLDWEGALFGTGHRQDYTLSGSYSTDKLRSYFSASYLHENGYRINTNLKRLSTRANVSYKATKWFEAGTNVSVTTSTSTAPKSASGSVSSNSFAFTRNIAPIYPIHVHNADGSYALQGGNKVYDYSATRPYNARFNPVYEAELDKATSVRDLISTRSFVRLTPIQGLTLTANVNYDVTSQRSKTRYNNIMGDQPQGLLLYAPNRYETTLINQLVDYKKTIGKHGLEFLVGHESYLYAVDALDAVKERATFTGIDEFSNYGTISELTSRRDEYAKESYFGRFNYDYDGRYNASLSYRRDGTSRFHPDARWGNFWSVGLGWNIHKERFMNSVRWVNSLKLRASLGQTGNDGISSYYAYRTLYSLGLKNYEDAAIQFGGYGNTNLVWESQVSSDIALEFSLFNHKLTGTFEYFNKESKDLLFSVPQPRSTGVSSIDQNIGKVRNYGFEFDLKYNVLRTKDWNWTLTANGTFLRNKIVRLPDANREAGITTGNFKYMEGYSIYQFNLYDFKGVDPADGRAMYLIDEERYAGAADPTSSSFVGVDKEGERSKWTKDGRFAKKVFHGTSIPTVQGGFGTELSWKNLDFGVTFAYQLGGYSYDGAYAGLMSRDISGGRAAHVDLLNAWTAENPNTSIPRLDAGAGGLYADYASQRYLTSKNALMLKSLSLGYTLPKQWVQRWGITNARISVAGENLFLLSKRQGFNPMDSFNGEVGAAYYGYSKTLTANLSISF